MKQGIQANFPHEQLRKYGCYFFGLLKWSEIAAGKSYSSDDIISLYGTFVRQGLMEEDCFLVNPIAILNVLCGKKFTDVTKAINKPLRDTFVVFLKKPGHSHFVLSHNDEIWDSLDPSRAGAGDYTIDSYRVFI